MEYSNLDHQSCFVRLLNRPEFSKVSSSHYRYRVVVVFGEDEKPSGWKGGKLHGCGDLNPPDW